MRAFGSGDIDAALWASSNVRNELRFHFPPISACTSNRSAASIRFAFNDRCLSLLFLVVSTGNEADLTASDFFDHLARDADTSIIMLFIEGVRDPAKFMGAAAVAAERGKPVIIAKMGRAKAGERGHRR
jgi:Succinyl-CoA ligase like flavodoxin domain